MNSLKVFYSTLQKYCQAMCLVHGMQGERNIAGLSANAKSACRILRKGIRLGLSYSSGTGAAQAAIGGAPAASAPALLTGESFSHS